ncbi:MAG: peptidoglycan DD-metalloendopeptidase family protein, partial [Clostridia bacterium]|nr:peptidoglycan DD-metalloendopeptidase family protein [Clostridia bacterium]
MKSMTAKALSLAICVCLAASAVFCALTGAAPKEVAAERTIETVEEEIKACEALISRLNSELAVLEEQIAQTDGETASTLEQAQLLAAQVAVLETQIELNESLLISCDMKRATAQAEYLLVQDEYDYYNELFSELMRFIYENGTTNEFELLFSSESLTDYLSRRDNFNSVMESVNDLRLSMEQSLLRLTELNDEYEQVSAQYASHLQTLENDKAALSDSLAELDALTAELGIQSEALAGAYAELSKNITEAKEKLSALRSEREELYQQQQKPEKPQEPSGGTGDYGFVWPLAGDVSYRHSSPFGWRTDPFTGKPAYHEGIDLACAKGSQILSAGAGVVTKAADYGGYGNCVIVYHGQDEQGRAITTLYGHASALKCV